MRRPMGDAFRGLLSVLLRYGAGVPTALLVGLKRGASRVVAGGCVGRTYGDLTGRTMGFPVVVNTVLDVTDNALDVATTATSTLRIVHDAYHSLFFFCSGTSRSQISGGRFSLRKRSGECARFVCSVARSHGYSLCLLARFM